MCGEDKCRKGTCQVSTKCGSAFTPAQALLASSWVCPATLAPCQHIHRKTAFHTAMSPQCLLHSFPWHPRVPLRCRSHVLRMQHEVCRLHSWARCHGCGVQPMWCLHLLSNRPAPAPHLSTSMGTQKGAIHLPHPRVSAAAFLPHSHNKAHPHTHLRMSWRRAWSSACAGQTQCKAGDEVM